MSNIQREKEIMALLEEKTYATVEYLSRAIHISPSSIRRDLSSLENQGLIKRNHGGASLIDAQPGMAPFPLRLHENKREKMLIAKAAQALIQPDMSIFLDSSTIAFSIYHFLSPDKNITVFTNNLQLAQLLGAKHIKTYCAGGCLSPHNSVISTGPLTLSMLSGIYVDLMFFASSALSDTGIITDVDENETAVRRLMLSHAKEKVFLCFHKRFGLACPFFLTRAEELDYLISDYSLSDSFKNRFPSINYMVASKNKPLR